MTTTIEELSNYRKFELITKAFNNYTKDHQNLIKNLILDATYQGEASTILEFMGIEYKIRVSTRKI